MKGFTLQINGECISGSIQDGITNVLVTLFQYSLVVWTTQGCLHIHGMRQI